MVNILNIFKSNIHTTMIISVNIAIIMYLIMLSYSIKKIYFYNEEKFNFLKNTIDNILESHELIQTYKPLSIIKNPNISNKKIQNKSKKQKAKIKKANSSNEIK